MTPEKLNMERAEKALKIDTDLFNTRESLYLLRVDYSFLNQNSPEVFLPYLKLMPRHDKLLARIMVVNLREDGRWVLSLFDYCDMGMSVDEVSPYIDVAKQHSLKIVRYTDEDNSPLITVNRDVLYVRNGIRDSIVNVILNGKIYGIYSEDDIRESNKLQI